MTTTATKERPILFSGPMVRAIIDGRKTQTRRVVRRQPPSDHPYPQECHRKGFWWNDSEADLDDVSFWPSYDECLTCPYGWIGDRLWVRETHAVVPRLAGCEHCCSDDSYFGVRYKATWTKSHAEKWTPSIHMLRWCSRITLEITDVRVERLNEIIPADAIAEGCPYRYSGFAPEDAPDFVGWYRDLWNEINGEGSWAANPWVWSLTFKRVNQ